MFSMSTASCNSPRPATSITSATSVLAILILTLPRISLFKRSRRWRLVRYLPSRPAYGDVLTPKLMRRTGWSTSRRGKAIGLSTEAMVSPTSTSSIPERMNKSPATTSVASDRSMPENWNRLLSLRFKIGAGFASVGFWQTATLSPLRSTPEITRPIASRPK